MMVPLSEPDITHAEIDAVVDVLRGTQLSLGPRMVLFEERMAQFTGATYAIAVSSGTAGLHLSLIALGIGRGDEVIVPSYTFIAAANAILHVGATPVFVDIDGDTLNMAPGAVAAAITPRTRALMVVHTFGVPADMSALQAIAQEHDLPIVEDACEALGARWNGRAAGSLGRLGVFAFYPNKQITTGEGGMVVTSDAALAARIRALRNQGREEGDAWHQHSLLGYNYRLAEMACALGCAQMARVEEILERRAALAQRYHGALQGIAGVRTAVQLAEGSAGHQSWFVYVVRIGCGDNPGPRDGVAKQLQLAGVQCARYFAPVHQQPAYADVALRLPLPVTERESRRTLALPFFNRLQAEQMEYVAGQLRLAMNALRSESPNP